jgi:NADPH:quinone reductase-like Zn-dependent oxidoreductase
MEHKNQTLNSSFKGLVLHKPNEIKYEEIKYDFDNLGNEYLVIEVKAAGLGPYDLGFVTGRLNTGSSEQSNIGCEGSGVVIKVGSSVDEKLVGQRVSFLSDLFDQKEIHSFAEYAVVKKDYVIPIDETISFNQGAYLLGNPLTAKCLYDEIISIHKGIVMDTASSALGKMINKIANKNNIKVINIVRRDESIELLKASGSDVVFNQNSPTFLQDLGKKIKEVKPSLYITCQGGGLPSRIIDLMPDNSTMCCLGNINNEQLSGYSSTDFIFKGKSIIGFQLFNSLAEKSDEQKKEIISSVIESLSKGENYYQTEIAGEFKFDQWEVSRESYEKNMSKGKIILKP